MEKLRDAPTVRAEFYKAHGHGNDYLVMETGDELSLTPDRVRRVCDRWRGVGGDGLVVVGPGGHGVAAELRMFNPDGSEFERSGNGLRVAALWLRDRGRVDHHPFTVVVGGDRIEMTVGEGSAPVVRVDMGTVRFPRTPPFVRADAVDASGQVAITEGVGAMPVSVGNPHAVVFGGEWSQGDLHRLGPLVSSHAAFPQGANVQFVSAVGDQSLSILIWERGVGRTTASGTSACAAAAATVRAGRLAPGYIRVDMEGGSFGVTVEGSYRVVLEGPVEAVCSGRLEPGFLADWDAGRGG